VIDAGLPFDVIFLDFAKAFDRLLWNKNFGIFYQIFGPDTALAIFWAKILLSICAAYRYALEQCFGCPGDLFT
jgi:hypothetical protein